MIRRKTKRQQQAEARFSAAVTDFIIGMGAQPGRLYD